MCDISVLTSSTKCSFILQRRDLLWIKRTHTPYTLVGPTVTDRTSFVELGGGVGDVLVWRCDGAYVEFGFR